MFIAEDVPSLNSESNVIFSPDERLILTGTGVKKNEGYGKVVMMNSENLEVVRTVSVSQSSVVKVLWHDKLNQVRREHDVNMTARLRLYSVLT